MPLNAFIVRPFGKKTVTSTKEIEITGQDGKQYNAVEKVEIDFDKVHRELIQPVLDRLRIQGSTTEAVVSSGNIREDMFYLLMTADLVLADVTIHNANVFYELGIRHAFHDKYTFLIRSEASNYPFDLQTDRYFLYDHKNPGKSVRKLAEALRATIASERADSPVFRLMPRLRSEDRTRFINVPRDFREEVDRARKYKRGGDLRLLAAECEGFLWEVEGLRVIGRAQFELNYIGGARATWEAIVTRYPNDVEANTILSTIYQRVNDPTRSEQALARIELLDSLDINTVAEVRALNARNFKSRWIADWKKKATPKQKQERALQSPLLRKAYEDYEAAFRANLNYAYAGLNALSLLIIEVVLAEQCPEVWQVLQERAKEGERELLLRKERIAKLSSAIAFAIESEHRRLNQEGRVDFWFEILEAAYLCLTAENPKHVEQAYLEAMIWAPSYAEEAMQRGLELYLDLDLKCFDEKVDIAENTRRALKIIESNKQTRESGRILLFAGLRMEAETWKPRRIGAAQLPAVNANVLGLAATSKGAAENGQKDKLGRKRAEISYLPLERAENAVERIKRRVEAEKEKGPILFGMAGGAGGSDIFFHEICQDLKIPTRLYLALPKDQYIGEYVAPAGASWVERFNKLYRAIEKQKRVGAQEPESSPATDCAKAAQQEIDSDAEKIINVLSDTKEFPRWLQGKANYNLERRCHLWMLQHALVQRHIHESDGQQVEITLIVLWDGGAKEGLGGIGDLVELAEKHGIKVVKIDCREWLDPQAAPPSKLRNEPTKPGVIVPPNSELPTKKNGALVSADEMPLAK